MRRLSDSTAAGASHEHAVHGAPVPPLRMVSDTLMFVPLVCMCGCTPQRVTLNGTLWVIPLSVQFTALGGIWKVSSMGPITVAGFGTGVGAYMSWATVRSGWAAAVARL